MSPYCNCTWMHVTLQWHQISNDTIIQQRSWMAAYKQIIPLQSYTKMQGRIGLGGGGGWENNWQKH